MFPGKEGSLKARRTLIGFTLLAILAVAVPAAPAGAAATSRDTSLRSSRLADTDGDGMDDVLERRLRRADRGSRQAVVVATDGSLSIADARRVAGRSS